MSLPACGSDGNYHISTAWHQHINGESLLYKQFTNTACMTKLNHRISNIIISKPADNNRLDAKMNAHITAMKRDNDNKIIPY